MNKYYFSCLLISLLACKQAKLSSYTPSPCVDENLESILSDSLGLRFLKADSFWTTCLDPQINTYYRDFDLMNFKGISDTSFSNNFEPEYYGDDYIDSYNTYYAYKEIDSITRSVVLVDFHGLCINEWAYKKPYIVYYPTTYYREDGIWKGKYNNFEYGCLRFPDSDYESNLYFLIQEGSRMYCIYHYKKKYNDGVSNEDYDGTLYMFTDSTVTGFDHINIKPILNQKAAIQLEQCDRIISSNKPFLKATYIKRYGYTFGIKGVSHNKVYSQIRPFPILGYLQYINHLQRFDTF